MPSRKHQATKASYLEARLVGAALLFLSVPSISAADDFAASWCLKTDMDFNLLRNQADVPLFVNALLIDDPDPARRCAADCNQDMVLDGRDIAPFIYLFSLSDVDGDGIPDLFETNDGQYLSLTHIGTSFVDPDSDADGQKDGEEVYHTLQGLNLQPLGASPVYKDLFIEVDWFEDAVEAPMHSHRPTPAVVDAMIQAFANSPIENRYGPRTGVALHIDYGQGGAFAGGNLIPGNDSVIVFDSEFNAYKASNFASIRRNHFHYAIFCHRYNTATNNSSGVAEINGDDFIVSLQTYLFDDYVAQTMMHELGHNLGLRHGGFEDLNYKPNYNSIMNYRYQFSGVDITCDARGDGVLDYSRANRLFVLDEAALDETAGVCDGGPAVDWNGDSVVSPLVSRNINCYEGASTECGVFACYDATCDLLFDNDDWSTLLIGVPTQGDLAAPEIVTCQVVPDGLPEE